MLYSSCVRSLIWRIARRLYKSVRRDGANNPICNGEHWLLDRIIQLNRDDPCCLIDIGTNRGDWTMYARKTLLHYSKYGVIHAFEPANSTFVFVKNRFKVDSHIQISNLALSDRTGETDFYVVGELAGTNSLYSLEGGGVQRVHTVTFDSYVQANSLGNIALVKSDTEGHDLSVLRGAKDALKRGVIDVWQFEYNHRWLANHASLMDVFELISDSPYRLGKLYHGGIEIFESWHPELDRYFEANYVLVRKGSLLESRCKAVRFNESNVLVAL